MSDFKRVQAKRQMRKAAEESQVSFDPMTMDPNQLRDSVRDSLLALPFEARADYRDQILSSLAAAGAKLGSIAVLLGISARQADEITPSELAHLIRYVRINSPQFIATSATAISRMMETADRIRRVQETPKAA